MRSMPSATEVMGRVVEAVCRSAAFSLSADDWSVGNGLSAFLSAGMMARNSFSVICLP